MKKILNWKLLLLLVFLFGSFLRVYQLGSIPSGFHADEAAFGYNAYSLLHTARDEYGKLLPIVLKSFGDYKGALYAYLDVPFVALLGLTPFAERLPSAIFGSLSIFLVYFITEKLLKNKKISLFSALVFSLSPWAINITRTTGDVAIALFFALLMVYSLVELQNKFSKLWFLVSLLSAFLAVISYAPYRIYVVFLPLIFLIISIRKIKGRLKFDKRSFSVLVTVLAIGILYTVVASVARFNQISIFSNPQTELIMQEQIREDQFTPVLITRIFHNKIVNYSRTILENTGQYFTFDYLFLNGGYPQRERIPDTGLFYIWEAPFLLIGLYAILRNKKRNEILLLLWWSLLLLPTVITFDEIPNVHRNLIILPPIAIIIGIGIYELVNYRLFRNTKFLILLSFLILIVSSYELLYFEHQYFVHNDLHHPWYRGYAYKELVTDLKKYYPNYKKIIVTKAQSSPYIYILFYSKYSPQKYQKEGSPRDLNYTGFDKYYFVPQDCPLTEGKTGEVIGEQGILYVDSGNCVVPKHNVKLLDKVSWQDGASAFKLMEFVATGTAQLKAGF